MEFNEMKAKYIKLKAEYELAIEREEWERAEAVEDEYLESEFNLVNWGLNQGVERGEFTADEADKIMKHMSEEQFKKMAGLTLQVVL